ncbi:MAG: MotA/TolQ/ExbB proton channel family protein [Salinivirgaceae bacterium]|nr:MotA/TolQ/ExbB proton channel family protein [Bacteroidales bacterium]
MKKLFLFFTVIGMLSFGVSTNVKAQEGAETTEIADTTQVLADTEAEATEEAVVTEEQAPQGGLVAVHQALKVKFIEGGPGFMSALLLCLVLGLALAIERIIYLNLASTDADKLLKSIEESLKNNNVEEAMETCRNTRGPVASIFYQALSRIDEGMDVVEKSIVSYGGVQTGLMEKGLSWISLFIAIGPMLGFLGTVIGMVQAFDAIEIAGDISPTLVAGGIKVALITTIGGLIVAMILQIFYNYLIAKIDGIVNTMEDSSITLIDMITEYNKKK